MGKKTGNTAHAVFPADNTPAETLSAKGEFARRLVAWQKTSGRHGLPWQNTTDPYRIWVSEIMLQQTQVATVTGYYERFLGRFPDVAALAAAPLEDVLSLWSGLGYYARARNLHALAVKVVEEYGGRFPDTQEAWVSLPGIGYSTASAVCVFAFGRKEAICDGNAVRVFARVFGIADVFTEPAGRRKFFSLAKELLPEEDIVPYTQGLMDLGATVCTRANPSCGSCPMADVCFARLNDRIALLPVAARKKPPVKKQFACAVVTDGECVLTSRRSGTLWGSLTGFVLGEMDESDDGKALKKAVSFARKQAKEAGSIVSAESMEPFEHVLTHRKITFYPVLVTVSGRQDAADGKAWMTWEALAAAGISAAVRKIIALCGRA